MDLGNPTKTVVHCLLNGRMTCLGHRDASPMVSALLCIVTHWTRPIVNHDINYRVFVIHQATIIHGLSILSGY